MFETVPDSSGLRAEIRAHRNPAALALLVALGVLSAGAFVACSGCGAPGAVCPPTVVASHVATETQCALIELDLDSGVTKTICLTADQIEKAMAQ
jgi:hypothetical protein